MCCSADPSCCRQIFVLLVACLYALSAGVMVAFPSVLNPTIVSPNSTDIKATSSQASWIASINGISGIASFFILSPIFQAFGRKVANITLNVILFVGWVTLYMASSVPMLFLGRAIQGLCIGGVFINGVTLSEYSSPQRRGYFMTIKKVLVGFGSLTCHSLALIFSWRQIAAISIIPVAIAIILILLWPESPAFLAMKGRFEECEKAFVWLYGSSLRSKKELKELIKAQADRLEREKTSNNQSKIRNLLKTLRKKEILKACLIVTLLTLCIDSCGRYFLITYITQILVEITGDQSIAMYCSVASDALLISALTISCAIIRAFNRRTLLFSFGSLTVVLMFIICLIVVLKSQYNILADVSWVTPFLILLHTFIAHVGIIPVAFAISSEIFPLEHRGLCSCISGVVFTMFYAGTLKMTPIMIEYTGISGTYAIYACIVIICLAILYVILPETKDKTLQEIEDEMRGKDRSEVHKDMLPERDTLIKL
ncbi:facilitated trehalose transporter Tret1-like [Battus philenor]|uniref:facilitated trehalose transporter Tret1-like n=1 Tax=Battus philenor TaxID=42288 RepID=UPI0035CEB96E